MTEKILAILLLASFTSDARIGETKAQCEKRYGKAIDGKPGETVSAYRKGGFEIVAIFLNGKCHYISFRTEEKNILGNSLDLSENIREKLLSANGENWKKVSQVSLDQNWESSDKKTFAQYGAVSKMLIVATSEYLEHERKKKTEEENRQLEGF